MDDTTMERVETCIECRGPITDADPGGFRSGGSVIGGMPVGVLVHDRCWPVEVLD